MKPDLCKMFGKEVNEEFRLSGIDWILKINEQNKLMFFLIGKWYPFAEQLNQTAQMEIIDIPWVPKLKELYWYVSVNGYLGNSLNVRDGFDMMRIKSGNCFKTEQQAREKGIPLMEQWKKELGW